ncbi:MAG: Nudix family hydrolase [Gallionellaceae bacterium]|jgi:8-oxo-dGTP diphosphatase
MNSSNTKIIEVAVAILQKPDGSFLLAQRPTGKDYAGYWEFPGGKVEAGETARDALQRELREEIGIEIETAYPWLTQVFTYPHATVRLNFFRVTKWKGIPHPHEGQELSWQPSPTLTLPRGERGSIVGNISVAPVLPANTTVLRALQLPTLYAISNVKELGTEVFLQRLQSELNKGLRLIQIREKGWARDALRGLALRAVAMSHAVGARVLLNEDIELAIEIGADGVQLTGAQLAACEVRPDVAMCAASCHSHAELQRAADLGLDFALLSPVLPTKSHPGAAHLGWEKFTELVSRSAIPVYALGGLQQDDMETAWKSGAHGIALLRNAW